MSRRMFRSAFAGSSCPSRTFSRVVSDDYPASTCFWDLDPLKFLPPVSIPLSPVDSAPPLSFMM